MNVVALVSLLGSLVPAADPQQQPLQLQIVMAEMEQAVMVGVGCYFLTAVENELMLYFPAGAAGSLGPFCRNDGNFPFRIDLDPNRTESKIR